MKTTIYRYSRVLPADLPTADQSDRFKLYCIETDKDGNELLKIEYDTEGNESEKFENTYNDKGQLIKRLHYFEGELAETFTYEYNADGLMSKQTLEYAEGAATVTHYTYEGKNLVEKKAVDGDGETEARETYRYENDLLVEEQRFNQDGELFEKFSFTYVKAGEKDRVQESIEWGAHDNSTLRTVNSYSEKGFYTGAVSYNAQGKVVGKHTVIEDENNRVTDSIAESVKEVIHRKFVHDANDNLLNEERYRNGELFYRMEQAFDSEKRVAMQSVSDPSGYYTDVYEYEL